MEAEPSRLRELLEALHAELSRTPPSDERGQALIRGLREDISRYDAPGVPAAETPPRDLRGRLREMAVGLEEAHPQLAAAVEQTMAALSNMGL